jgi:hypothetical protein
LNLEKQVIIKNDYHSAEKNIFYIKGIKGNRWWNNAKKSIFFQHSSLFDSSKEFLKQGQITYDVSYWCPNNFKTWLEIHQRSFSV